MSLFQREIKCGRERRFEKARLGKRRGEEWRREKEERESKFGKARGNDRSVTII